MMGGRGKLSGARNMWSDGLKRVKEPLTAVWCRHRPPSGGFHRRAHPHPQEASSRHRGQWRLVIGPLALPFSSSSFFCSSSWCSGDAVTRLHYTYIQWQQPRSQVAAGGQYKFLPRLVKILVPVYNSLGDTATRQNTCPRGKSAEQ